MKIFEIREVTNPDWSNYSDSHVCYVAAKSINKAYKKAKVRKSGYYPIKQLSKRESKNILNTANSKINEQKITLSAYINYLETNDSKLVHKLIKKTKCSIKSLKTKYFLILS